MDISDVLALVGTQKTIQETIPGFKFVLGYSGKHPFTEYEGERIL